MTMAGAEERAGASRLSHRPQQALVVERAQALGKEFQDDNLTDWAAALTYYGVLSIFPALIVLVSLLGLIGTSVTSRSLDNLGEVAPGPAQDILTSAIENLQGNQGALGRLLRDRAARRRVGGLGLRRRLHARLQLDLRHRGGPAHLEDAAARASDSPCC